MDKFFISIYDDNKCISHQDVNTLYVHIKHIEIHHHFMQVKKSIIKLI
jgi:hypothetical protein